MAQNRIGTYSFCRLMSNYDPQHHFFKCFQMLLQRKPNSYGSMYIRMTLQWQVVFFEGKSNKLQLLFSISKKYNVNLFSVAYQFHHNAFNHLGFHTEDHTVLHVTSSISNVTLYSNPKNKLWFLKYAKVLIKVIIFTMFSR